MNMQMERHVGLIIFEGCNDGKIEDILTGVQYGINYGLGWYVSGWLGTVLVGMHM